MALNNCTACFILAENSDGIVYLNVFGLIDRGHKNKSKESPT